MTAGAALLIGNQNYSGPFPRLRTPVSDVTNLDDRLRALGFETVVSHDADRAEMGRSLSRFRQVLERLSPERNALIYFAGHGLQHAGENYLVPVDAAGADASEVYWSCLRLSEIMDALCWRDDQQKWIALDACRSNDLPGSIRNGAAGMSGDSLRRYERVKETTVLYATEPGHYAQDGAAYGSSPFCRGLLDALKQPHRSVRELTLHVTDFVCQATADMQTPWESAHIRRSRPFVPLPEGEAAAASILPTLPTARQIVSETDRYVAERGHLIHKLKAKDTSGQWAYYFVLVEPSQEAAFLSSLGGAGTMDIEEFGRVVASSYGASPSREVRQYLKERYGFDV